MEKLGLNEIREKYLRFFEERGHLRLPSFSLVPKNDPSILLINAGMTPIKPYFTGREKPPASRITTCQKCIRTGDIENVGYTDRHGTFFEMLGNFSFGDYFKAEMIPWIWEFCTEVLGMPGDRLYPSVYEEDDEAYDMWHETVGVPKERIYRFGKADNFWEHGTGPCGPCTEVYFDRGVQYGCGEASCEPGCECDRFVEFWNSVFTQFDRQEDGSYLPLAQKNIDTGVGLERLATIMQDVGSIFEVDTIRSILDKVCAMSGVEYGKTKAIDVPVRIITDHIRSTVMMIGDGITPSNSSRGYVLRRLMRRAIRNGRLLGIEGPFLTELAAEVIRQSGGAYPELLEHEVFIMNTIANEQKSFDRTLQQGNQMLTEYIDAAKAAGTDVLSAEDVFRLHDTYGFPVDLTKEIAAESGLDIDNAGFAALMAEQRLRAQENTRQNVKTAWGGLALPEAVGQAKPTVFSGYETLEDEADLLYLISQNAETGELALADSLGEDERFMFVTDRTPFYATGGGQEGDFGLLTQGENCLAEIRSVSKTQSGLYLHQGVVVRGILRVGGKVTLSVDKANRMATARNHTSTHLLHKALREVLGSHVTQAGSEVNADHLRFDFNHFSAVTQAELEQIAQIVNDAILADYAVTTQVMSVAEAKTAGAMALFDEKYGDAVRVVSCEDFSMELCGGTHLRHTAQAGSFRILSESSIAAGVRRIEAVTGARAQALATEDRRRLQLLAAELKSPVTELETRVASLVQDNRDLQRELQQLTAAQARAQNADLYKQAVAVRGVQVLVAAAEAADADGLRDLGDDLRSRLAPAVIVLAREAEGKLNFLVMASPEAVAAGVHAGRAVKAAATTAGGGGGGRPDMAQAGGKLVEKLGDALAAAKAEVYTQLGETLPNS